MVMSVGSIDCFSKVQDRLFRKYYISPLSYWSIKFENILCGHNASWLKIFILVTLSQNGYFDFMGIYFSNKNMYFSKYTNGSWMIVTHGGRVGKISIGLDY